MTEIQSIVAMIAIILLVILVIWKLWQAFDNSETSVEWYQLVSSEGKDGKQYASATKLCLLMTFFVSTLLITYIVFRVDWTQRAGEVCILIGSWMLFGAGVEGYAKHLRMKSDVAIAGGSKES